MKTIIEVPTNGITLTKGRSVQGGAKNKNQDTGDVFGGRPGSQAHRINTVLIKGVVGTARDIAIVIAEPVPNVSAQLSWLHKKKLVARKPVDGHRYIYRISKEARKLLPHN